MMMSIMWYRVGFWYLDYRVSGRYPLISGILLWQCSDEIGWLLFFTSFLDQYYPLLFKRHIITLINENYGIKSK